MAQVAWKKIYIFAYLLLKLEDGHLLLHIFFYLELEHHQDKCRRNFHFNLKLFYLVFIIIEMYKCTHLRIHI